MHVRLNVTIIHVFLLIDFYKQSFFNYYKINIINFFKYEKKLDYYKINIV